MNMEKITSLSALCSLAREEKKEVSELVLEFEAERSKQSKEDILKRLYETLKIMEEAKDAGLQKGMRSKSGLSGGIAPLFLEGSKAFLLTGEIMRKAMGYALSISEYNACMGRIVAAPTAGSCGILPGCLLSVMEELSFSREKIAMSLLTAAAVGEVIEYTCSLSGAHGGCQEECGAASAMAAAAVAELLGGGPDGVENASALAIKFIMGLVCDPIAGLVEVPCVKRNASGAANALVAAELALSGVKSFVPVDQVFLAMKEVGFLMDYRLKETSLGGLANTKCARCVKEKMKEL